MAEKPEDRIGTLIEVWHFNACRLLRGANWPPHYAEGETPEGSVPQLSEEKAQILSAVLMVLTELWHINDNLQQLTDAVSKLAPATSPDPARG